MLRFVTFGSWCFANKYIFLWASVLQVSCSKKSSTQKSFVHQNIQQETKIYFSNLPSFLHFIFFEVCEKDLQHLFTLAWFALFSRFINLAWYFGYRNNILAYNHYYLWFQKVAFLIRQFQTFLNSFGLKTSVFALRERDFLTLKLLNC